MIIMSEAQEKIKIARLSIDLLAYDRSRILAKEKDDKSAYLLMKDESDVSNYIPLECLADTPCWATVDVGGKNIWRYSNFLVGEAVFKSHLDWKPIIRGIGRINSNGSFFIYKNGYVKSMDYWKNKAVSDESDITIPEEIKKTSNGILLWRK